MKLFFLNLKEVFSGEWVNGLYIILGLCVVFFFLVLGSFMVNSGVWVYGDVVIG